MSTELKTELASQELTPFGGARSVGEGKGGFVEVDPYKLPENKAMTDILKVLKFDNKGDEEVFNRLPLTDRQKEQLLFDTLPELKDFKKIFGTNKE
jgi:hypothetical protein